MYDLSERTEEYENVRNHGIALREGFQSSASQGVSEIEMGLRLTFNTIKVSVIHVYQIHEPIKQRESRESSI